MKRIVLIGQGGAGKSTLARKLGEILGIPVYHLDALYWRPGWVESPREEFLAKQREIVAQDAWIVDGNYSGSMEIRTEQADTIIWMDLPRWVCVWRVFQRLFMYMGKTRPDVGEGCEEKVDLQFLSWVWNFRKTRRPALAARMAELAKTKQVIQLKSPAEVRRFLAEVVQSTR